jgi:hypothetical protein
MQNHEKNPTHVGVVFLIVGCSPVVQSRQFSESDLQTAVAGTMESFAYQSATTNTPLPTINEITLDALTTASTSIPTMPSPINLLLPTPLSSDNFSTPILFDVNGTYKDIMVDAIPAGETRMFSINAMQGQVMAVSTWRQGGSEYYLPEFRIMGVDGTILCPTRNRQCMFWHGVLPSTQNYFLIFTADPNLEAASFMMRVAVNPPGVKEQYFQYKNSASGVSLTFSDLFAPTGGFLDGYISTGNYKIQPDFILHLIDTNAFESTNLDAVYLTIGSTRDAQIANTCLETDWNGLAEQTVGTEIINGYEFFHTRRDGVGSGHYGEQEIYRMILGSVCYEVIYHIHSVDIGYLSSGTVVEFNRSAILQKLNDVFYSFTID